MIWTATIYGPPTTKKTSNRIWRNARTGKPFVVPSPQYKAWEGSALVQLRLQSAHRPPHLAVPVNVKALIYRVANRGDLNNYTAAIADVLQAADWVVDDKWIQGWDGSRLLKDAARPRVELTVEALRAGGVGE